MRMGTSLVDVGSIDALVESLEKAVADGFDSAWLANIFGLDAMTALAVAGSRVPGIELGTAVTPTYFRHPLVLARQAITTDLATGGRLALGIGLSHQVVIEGMLHLSFDKPARHMREYLAVLLPLVREGKASYAGETLGADAELVVRPAGPLPVLLAALAPRMLHLAGAEADGTVLWMTGPKVIESHIAPRVREAAAGAGRPARRIVCVLPVCVTDDEAAARDRAARAFAVYDTLPSYKAMLDAEGAAGPADVALVGDEASVRRQIEALGALRPRAVHTASVRRLPDGQAYYDQTLRLHTTTTYTGDEIHRIGLDQVRDLHTRIDALLRVQGYTQVTVGERLNVINKEPRFVWPNTDEGRAGLLASLNAQMTEIMPRLPRVLSRIPKTPMVFRRVPPAIEQGAPGGYAQPGSLDGSRLGAFYINLEDTACCPK